jgi:hypothetical protein
MYCSSACTIIVFTMMINSAEKSATVLLFRVSYMNIGRAKKLCQSIACTRSLGMGLTPAEDQKLKCLIGTADYIFISNTKM